MTWTTEPPTENELKSDAWDEIMRDLTEGERDMWEDVMDEYDNFGWPYADDKLYAFQRWYDDMLEDRWHDREEEMGR